MSKIIEKDFINDLYLFYRYFIASNYKESVPAPHIHKLANKLMELALTDDGKHRLAVSMPPRHPIENECPVLTTNGWKKHGDLKVGDYVFSPNGNPIKVIEVHPKTMVDNCLEFSNGDKIVCGDEHLWKVYDRVNRKYSLLETQQIMNRKLKQVNAKKYKTSTFTIDVTDPLEFPYQEVPIDPYWLGLWLGDGHHKRPSITLHKNDIITTESTPYEVIRYDAKGGDCVEAIYSHQGLTGKLRELGVYGDKHIPNLYLYNSYEVRMQLLAGLIDSDGCLEKERNRIIFSNTNKKLLKQVYELLVGLGFKVNVSKQTSDEQNNYKKHCKSNYNIITKKDIYHLRIYAHKNIPTKLSRKQIKNKKKRNRIGLTNAYKVKSVEGNCITVDSDDGLYLVGNHLTITHNSKSSMVTLAFPLWLLFQDPNVNIMIVTGSPKLAEKFGIQLREYVRDLGHYFNVYLSNVKQASTHIMFCDKNNKLYKGNILLASSGGGITGQDADYLILDDPYTGNDSEFTPSALQQKIDWINRVVEQRIEPHTKYPISNDCPVKTVNRGWITHGEIEVGDILLTPNGGTTRVMEVLPKTSVDNCFEFSNGDKIISGDNHLWKFYDTIHNTTRLFETQEIMEQPTFIGNTYVANFKIPYKNKCISLIDKYKVPKVEGNCINVDDEKGMYLIGKNLTPTHNCVLHTRWHPLKLDTPILTSNRGWTTHGELKTGDYVYQPNGEPTRVTKVHPPVPINNCFEFTNGDKLISGDHHIWKVYDWGNRKYRLMETSEIMERPTIVGKSKSRCNFLVENHECLKYSYKPVPIDPYWLGLWLGDGHHKKPSILCDVKDTISVKSTPYEIIRFDEHKGNCVEAVYTHQGIISELKKLNVYGNKHIPQEYLHNSKEVRLQLLAGLIDSDGSVEKSSNRVVFVNTNKELLKNTHELITGLGFNVKINKRPVEKMNEYKEKNNYSLFIESKLDAYALRFTPHYPIPTKVPRKKILGDGVHNRVGLKDTYKVDTVLGNCITVEAEDGMYLVGKNLTPTHNSDDIIGYYKATDEESYDFIEFPAIQEDGTPLWSERYTIEDLMKKKETVGERVFSSVYQQQPIDTSSDFFNMKHLKYGYPEDFSNDSSARAWDIASSDALSNNDFTAGVRMIRSGEYAIITDLVHGRFGNNTKDIIKTTAFKDTPTVHIVIETGVAGAGKLLFSEWSNQLKGYIVNRAEVSGGKSKVDRATPFKNAIEDGKVYIAIEDDELREVLYDELSSFPVGKHDDIVDACAHVYNYLFVEMSKPKPRAKLGVVWL